MLSKSFDIVNKALWSIIWGPAASRLPTLQDDARQSYSRNQNSTRSLSESLSQSINKKKNKTSSAFNSLASGQAPASPQGIAPRAIEYLKFEIGIYW